MANEGTLTINLNIVKGNFTYYRQATGQFTVSGTHQAGQTQNIGMTAEALAIPADVATLGVAFFRNLDSSLNIDLGTLVSTGVYSYFARIKPGEFYPLRLKAGQTYYAIASGSAGADLEWFVNED